MSEVQVFWWIERLRGHIPAVRGPSSYGLRGKKLAYGVDYGNYMHQVAAEFGGAPAVGQLLHRPRALLAYCFGQAYIPFFRLVGPFANEEAWRVASTELYGPVRQRGLFTNGIFLVTLLAFGAVSLGALALEKALGAPAALARALRLAPAASC